MLGWKSINLLLTGLLLWLTVAPAQGAPGWQKGFTFYDEPPVYGSPEASQSLQRLRATGATVVVPVVTWYVPDRQSSTLVPGPLTPSDQDLANVVDEARRQGLQVVLAVHVNSLDNTWRGQIDPSDKYGWFGAYRQILIRYADFARQHDVQGMIVASELVELTRVQYTEEWRSLIRDVRERFQGFLTYGAQWGAGGPESQDEPLEEYTQIGFWSELDYVGIAAYFNLADSAGSRPSREELKRTWAEWRQREVDPFQTRVGKPVLFTEVGYRSAGSAAAQPWDHGLDGSPDPWLQADLYAALFETWHEVPWFQGVYLWYWPSASETSATDDIGYSPQGKPAEGVVRDWFSRT